ncbi:MAG: lipid-A-disaccharide synthase [Alphaproteobacteria bacterium]|nr:lipid-A-disaccharide synthase [Alphaproteobacteria bacterium]
MTEETPASETKSSGKVGDCLKKIIKGLETGMGRDQDSTFFLVAGEASGDLLGARLMKALKAKAPKVRFLGVGGPQMQAEGLGLLFSYTELMHFGIVEVARHIPKLLRRIEQTAEAVVEAKPTALITIDSPDFSFRVAKRVKALAGERIKLIHYVAPTVWAWRPGRAKTIAKFLDRVLAVFPFEPSYFTREGLPCTFVGHSVVEGGADKGDGAAFRKARKIPEEALLLAVLPGSRTSEISRLLPVFRKTVRKLREKHPQLRMVVPTVPHLKDRVAKEVLGWDLPVYIVESEKDKFDAFAASTAALACSGTVALELALARLPGVIAYKLNPVTVALFKRLIKVKYANLVNIMHDEMVVPEYLQNDCTPEKLFVGVDKLLSDRWARRKQIGRLEATAEWLGKGKFVPSERAAQAVMATIKPPVVLQVLPALVTGGVERGTVETTAALVKAGFKAIVASEGGPLVKDIEAAGGMHVALPLASKNPLVMTANIVRLCKVIREHGVDIVHARSRAPAWSAWAAAKRTGAAFVTTFHNAYGAKSGIKRFYNSVMGKGARVIAISEFVGDYAEKTYGVSREILHVIPRGVDFDVFDPRKVDAARIDALRKTWELDDKASVILMPGRFTRWKGQLVLLQALSRLRRSDFVCVIVGGGKAESYGQEVMADVEELRLKDHVKIFDTCADMAAAYALADVVTVPSIRPEGFGRVIVEAQAMGTPVIASDHGGAKETVIPGKTGWLVAPNDAVALAEALEEVLGLPDERKADLATAAQAHVRDHFTTAGMTSKTIDIYRDLLLQRRIERE